MIANVSGLPTAWAVTGDGHPLLLLHGWGASMQLVEPLAQQLAPLGYRVYTLDLPGFGATALPPSAWSVHDYANFILAFLDTHALERVLLFGHSFGGRLGLVLGAQHPARIVKMALANSAGVRTRPSRVDQMRLSLYRTTLNALRSVRLSAQADTLRDWYRHRYGSADYRAAQGVLRDSFVRVVSEDLLIYAAQVQVPTLLFWGDRDEDTPLWQGRLLEQTIPDAGLVLWEGAGHYSYLDRLGETARVMHHFFQQSDQA